MMPRRVRYGILCGVVCLIACADAPPSEDEAATEMLVDAPQAPPAVVGASACDEAEPIGLGRWRGEFAPLAVALTGGCGAPGPVAHFAVEVDVAGDLAISAEAPRFLPEIGVRFEHCEHPWAACRLGATDWITDVAAGTRLLVTVTAPLDAVLPERIGSAPTDFHFTLAIRSRRVLGEGEPCNDEARCASGTRCAPLDASSVRVCTPVPGERCSAAIDVVLDPEQSIVLPTPEGPWPADDHEHACGGGDRPEWVYRLVPREPARGTLRVVSSPGTLLAVRAATCLPSDEIACGEDALTLDPEVWSGSEPLFLFVEAAPDDGDAPPPAPVVRADWRTTDA